MYTCYYDAETLHKYGRIDKKLQYYIFISL